ncbi:MAG TPA: HAMP domain-containing sensor histidine kinase [Geothrix sp.]|nr:HAMP domain-containing sensor histidine kinase [Geothrix sp.]
MSLRPASFTIQRLVFILVSVFLCVQVGWWIQLQIRESRRLLNARIMVLKSSRAEAWQMDSLQLLAYRSARPGSMARTGAQDFRSTTLPTFEERSRAIQQAYPHVAVVLAPTTSEDPALLDGSAYLALRPQPLQELFHQRERDLIRVVSEGAFMVMTVLAGLVMLYQKLAEELDLKRRQHNFTSAVTHELKTPIASMRVWTDTIFTRELSESQRQHIHELMDRDLDRLNELVGNLLDVARAESGSLVVHRVPMEVGPWLKSICEAMDHRLGQGSLGLTLEISPEAIWVQGDPKALGHVVENLLSNAHKYAQEPRRTTVTLDGDDRDAILVVNDAGQGINATDLQRIFHRFYRGGDELTRQVGGTGLGLFLAKEIVARHQGEIIANSRGPGLGASFTLRLARIPEPIDV